MTSEEIGIMVKAYAAQITGNQEKDLKNGILHITTKVVDTFYKCPERA